MSKTEGAAALLISGFSCDPNDITEWLGLRPSRSWCIGESIQNTMLKRKCNGWELSSRLNREHDIGEHIDELMLQIEPVKEKLLEFPGNLEKMISCVLYVSGDDRPPIYVSKHSITAMARIGASLDVDIYYL